MDAPLAQATAHANNTVSVFADRVEIRNGWQGQNVDRINLRDVAIIGIRGWVNCTLTLGTNQGRIYRLEHMALPDARAVKYTIERQKQKAGVYE